MFSLKSGGRSARLRAEEDSGPNKLGRSVPAPATMRRFNASISDRRLWNRWIHAWAWWYPVLSSFWSTISTATIYPTWNVLKTILCNILRWHWNIILQQNSTRLELQQNPAIFMETLPWTPTKINKVLLRLIPSELTAKPFQNSLYASVTPSRETSCWLRCSGP